MGKFKRCCCCPIGSTIDRWQNQTKVRPAGDSGGTHYTATPYGRYDIDIYNAENPGAGCNTLPAGTCGTWLAGADLNGISAQAITNAVDDIGPCGADDSTHAKIDHNCYVKSGTVDMSVSRLFGFQTVLAKKFWHGRPGLVDVDSPNLPNSIGFDAGAVADGHAGFTGVGTGFSLAKVNTLYTQSALIVNTSRHVYGHDTRYSSSSTSWDWTVSDENQCTSSIAKATGIETRSWAFSGTASGTTAGGTAATPVDMSSSIFTWLAALDFTGIVNYFASFQSTPVGSPWPDGTTFVQSGTTYEVHYASSTIPFTGGTMIVPAYVKESISIDLAGLSFSRTIKETKNPWPYTDGGIITIGNLLMETLTLTNTGISYSKTYTPDTMYNGSTGPDGDYENSDTTTTTATLTLSASYVESEIQAALKTLFDNWNLLNPNLAKLRTDEALALAPLCVYDEWGPAQPTLECGKVTDTVSSGTGPTMDDYSQPQNSDGTWPQRSWIDSANFMWRDSSGGTSGTMDPAGGNILVTPLRTGASITHTQAGSDHHFWFGYAKLKRVSCTSPDPSGYTWLNDTYGDFSDPRLPSVSLRWMNNAEAQYDGELCNSSAFSQGNLPQSWIRQRGGIVVAGKYVCATQTWPAYNKGRPCGWDRFVADQTTVCSVQSGDASSGFVVKPTRNAIAPLATGGLAVGDKIIDANIGAGGIYQIATITDNGDGTFTITVGSKLDDLPTAYALKNFAGTDGCFDTSEYIGRPRWPDAPGLCGRMPITATYSAPSVTFVPSASLPTLRLGAGAAPAVDIYDAAMTLLAAGITLTRVDDTHFTAVHAAIPTAAYMVAVGADWTQYSAASRRTGVRLEYAFDLRLSASGGAPVGGWYAATPGCATCTETEFTYADGCPVGVGFVPAGAAGVESSFPRGDLAAMPATIYFDYTYGACWQGITILTMPDPFWQTPFVPAKDGYTGTWKEDDGTASSASCTGTDKFFAHHPVVEATTSSAGLPAGIYSMYDPAHNAWAPPYWPNGIPIGDALGNYGSIPSDWGFACRVKNNPTGLFATSYSYVFTAVPC